VVRILLISMPWHALERPSLGLSLLKAALERNDHTCDIRYLGFDLADSIGIDDYLWVHGELPYTAFAGDWLFTEALYGRRHGADKRYFAEVWRGQWQLTMPEWERLLRIRRRVEPFLDHCDRLPWEEYDVVGFTSTFEQNIASLALARRIKESHPGVVIAFGGANWEGVMGLALHRRFRFVDVAASGEADISFPAVVNTLERGGDWAEVPGLVVREPDGSSYATGPGSPVRRLDDLPVPSYDDYLAHREASPAAVDVLPTLLLETSRGCWWGAKHHCTFCGLNGSAMAFRSKSADRVLEEVRQLQAAGADTVAVVDNILDMHYFSTLLPELAGRGAPLGLFYEVKANLTRQQVALLARSGVQHVQPGIESLSDGVLRLMRKGTTALQNIQLLKWCAEYGVVPEWNFLYGFPGEDPEEYRRMAGLIDALGHLPPPTGSGPLRLDRFSPYYDDPAAFGITKVRPFTPYRHLYDVQPEELMQIAYYFEFEYADGRDLGYVTPALERITEWIARGPAVVLTVTPAPDGTAILLDTRNGTVRRHRLESWQAVLFDALDGVTSEAALLRRALSLGVAEATGRGFLHACADLRIAANVGDRWLGLAVHDPPRWEEHATPRRRVLEVLA
jgi:ribosomal peptide maturation radical SAM protein 1